MRRVHSFLASLTLGTILAVPTGNAYGQGLADPLTLQGIDRTVPAGARARAMGGTVLAHGTDANALFNNPALLSWLQAPEAHLGGSFSILTDKQHQVWIPNRLYAELSLVFQNDQTFVTKPFDTVKPDWEEKTTAVRPTTASVAVPFGFSGLEAAAGVGFAQEVDLDHYFRNNNALDPNIGQLRPQPIPRITQGDSLIVSWYQFARSRKGSMYSITPGISMAVGEHLSLGASLSFLNGSTDDAQERIDRGRITLRYNNNFSLDSVVYRQTVSGTSRFKATGVLIGAAYREQVFSVGGVLRLATKVRRDFDGTLAVIFGAGANSELPVVSSDYITLPLEYSVGVAVYPSKDVTAAIDYEVRNYSKAEYAPAVAGPVTNPWIDGKAFRLGVEYRASDWLSLRGGYRTDPQVFAPEGTGLMDEPARGSVYTAGAGLRLGPLTIDAAYEYALLDYQDMWQSNVNYNTRVSHSIVIETALKF